MIGKILGVIQSVGSGVAKGAERVSNSSVGRVLGGFLNRQADEETVTMETFQNAADQIAGRASATKPPVNAVVARLPFIPEETLNSFKVKAQVTNLELNNDVEIRVQDVSKEPETKFDRFKESILSILPPVVAVRGAVAGLKSVIFADKKFVLPKGSTLEVDSDRIDILDAKVAFLVNALGGVNDSIKVNNDQLDELIEQNRREALRRRRQADEEDVERTEPVRKSLVGSAIDAIKEKAGETKDNVVDTVMGPIKALKNSPIGQAAGLATEYGGKLLGKIPGVSRAAGAVANVGRAGMGMLSGVGSSAMGALGSAGSAVMGGIGSAASAAGGAIASGASALGGAAMSGLGSLAAAAGPALAAAAPFIAGAAAVAAVGYGVYKLGSWMFGKDEEDLEELRADRPEEDPWKPQLKWFSEMKFATNNPDAYEEFKEFREDKKEDIEDYGVLPDESEWQAKQVAINNFADEIIQAQAGEPSEHYTGDEEYVEPKDKPEDLTTPGDGKVEKSTTQVSNEKAVQLEAMDNPYVSDDAKQSLIEAAQQPDFAAMQAKSNAFRDKMGAVKAEAQEALGGQSGFYRATEYEDGTKLVETGGAERLKNLDNPYVDDEAKQALVNGFKVGSVERPSELRGREIPAMGAAPTETTIEEGGFFDTMKGAAGKAFDFMKGGGLVGMGYRAIKEKFSDEETPSEKRINAFLNDSEGVVGQTQSGVFMDTTDVADDFGTTIETPQPTEESGGIWDTIKSGAGKAFDFMKGGGLLGMGYRAIKDKFADDESPSEKRINAFLNDSEGVIGQTQSGIFMDTTDVSDDFGAEDWKMGSVERPSELRGAEIPAAGVAQPVEESGGFFDRMKGIASKALEYSPMGMIKKGVDFAKEKGSGLLDSASSFINDPHFNSINLSPVSEGLSKLASFTPMGMASKLAGKAMDSVSPVFEGVKEKAGAMFGSAADFVYDKTGVDIEELPSMAMDAVGSGVETVKEKAGDVMSTVGDIGTGVTSGMKQASAKIKARNIPDDVLEEASSLIASRNLARADNPMMDKFFGEKVEQSESSIQLTDELEGNVMDLLKPYGIKSLSEAETLLENHPALKLDMSGADEFDFDAPLPSEEPISNNVVSMVDRVPMPNPVADVVGSVKRASKGAEAKINEQLMKVPTLGGLQGEAQGEVTRQMKTAEATLNKLGMQIPNPGAEVSGVLTRGAKSIQAKINSKLPSQVREMMPDIGNKIEEVLPMVSEMKEAIGAPPMIMLQPKQQRKVQSASPHGPGQNALSENLTASPSFNTKDAFRRVKEFI